MTRKLIFTALCASLFTACSQNNQGKMIRKTLPTVTGTAANGSGDSSAGQDASIKRILNDNKECFPLSQLIKQFKSQKGTNFTAYIMSRDLVEHTDFGLDTIGATRTAEKEKSWQGDDKTRARILIAEQNPMLVSSFYGEQIETSELIGSLVKIDKQTLCDSVSISGAIFKIEAKKKGVRPNAMVLTKDDQSEQRVYSVTGTKMHIITLQSAGTVTPCKGKPSTSLDLKTHYVIDFSGNDNLCALQPTFATLLNSSVQNPYKNLAIKIASSVVEKSGNGRKLPARRPMASSGSSGVEVSVAALDNFSRQIKGGLLKSNKCEEPKPGQDDEQDAPVPPIYQ